MGMLNYDMKSVKRTNSVISSLYQPIGNSKIKSAVCMLVGGLILICLGVGLIVSTLTVRHPSTVSVDETSVLISGPTCCILGVVVSIMSVVEIVRHRNAQNTVETELNRVISSMGKPQQDPAVTNPKVSIVINKALWN